MTWRLGVGGRKRLDEVVHWERWWMQPRLQCGLPRRLGDPSGMCGSFEWSVHLEVDTFNPPGRGDMEFGNGVSRLDTLC